ncbi:hypothetical protein PoB_000661900 [Plakobranchus ocellatus]|uniref:Uncharacterized protein n=1 Tax=Plakobranchus ocellatus TaxID=259542 RepID=A0AAV3YAU1_9GAST|nr:hypothetical protein PoB_000661900 [Plakobranchus ocellatus]
MVGWRGGRMERWRDGGLRGMGEWRDRGRQGVIFFESWNSWSRDEKLEDANFLNSYENMFITGSPSGQGAGGGTRTSDRRVPADLRVDSLATEPPRTSVLI